MGKVASLVAGLALLGIGALSGGTATFAFKLGVALVLGAVSQITAKVPSFKSQARTSMVRQAITTKKVIIGEMKTSGPLIFYASTNDNSYHHLVVALADHECQSIGTVYLNDTPIYSDQIDGSGGVTSGRFNARVRIKKHLGGAGQVADADLVSEVAEWTNAHVGTGVCYLYVRVDFNAQVFPNGLPNISAVVKGAKMFDPRTSLTEWSPNAAIATRHYLTDTKHGRGAALAEINDTEFITASNVCDEFVTTKDIAMTVNTVDTTAETLSFDGETLKFQNGDRVEITTTGTVPTGLALVTPYYVIMHKEQEVLADDDAKTVLERCEIKLATTYANALAETAIDITGAGTGTHTITKDGEPRYTSSGLIDTASQPFQVIEELLSAMGGTASFIGGKWRVKSAAWTAPALTFDESHLVGGIAVQTKVGRRDRFNAVKGTFVNSHLSSGQPTDYPPITNATYETEDNNERIETDLDLPFTSRAGQAQRLAKIHLERHRQEIMVEVSFNLHAYQVIPGDVERIDNTRFGWTAKEFEVVESKFDVGEQDGVPVITINQKLRETASANFDWASGEETVLDPAPNTTLPNPFLVGPPTSVMLSSGTTQLLLTSEGSVISRILVTWTAPLDAFVEKIEVQAKKNLDSEWEPVPDTTLTRAIVSPVEDGTGYDVRVRSRNHLSVNSVWVQVLGHTVIGKTAAPTDVDTFTFEQQADGTRLFRWTHTAPDADVKSGGGYRIRYKLGATSDWSVMFDLHSPGLVLTAPYESNELSSGTYTFAIKAFDSSGNESANALFINSAALGNPRLANALVQRNERVEGWPGTIVSGYIDVDGSLRATGSADWSTLPATWSALAADWDNIVASNSPLDYTTPTIDISQDLNFRPLVTAEGLGTPTITMQTGTDADGAPVGAFVALGTVTARYIKVKVSMAGTTPAIERMITILDSPAETETYEDVDISSATDVWFENLAGLGHFRIGTRGGISAITQARINAIQNVGGGGYTWELISKTAAITGPGTLAAEFKIYDETDTLADATVDVILRGAKV